MADLKLAAAASIQPAKEEVRQEPIWEDLARLASIRPRTAILRAWQQVEATLIRMAKNQHVEAAATVWQMPMVLGALMLNTGKISVHQYDLLSRLRQLVNEATHAAVDTVVHPSKLGRKTSIVLVVEVDAPSLKIRQYLLRSGFPSSGLW